MRNSFLFLSFFFTFLIAQENKDISPHEDISKYKKVIVKTSGSGGWWKKVFLIDEGKIFMEKNYFRNRLMSKNKRAYNSKGMDTLNRDLRYDESGRLVYENGFKYSDFDKKGNPQKMYDGFGTNYYKYDSLNRFIEIKSVNVYESIDTVVIKNAYKYDKFNNIIEIKRTCEKGFCNFPIIMLGGRSKYEFERFRYVYNKNGLWIKKYWIVEDRKKIC